MKVLLLHPDDQFSPSLCASGWDLVVDLARAPAAIYETWSRQVGCRVISLHDFANEVEDLYCIRDLFRSGLGKVVDHYQIDWWDALLPMLLPDFQKTLLLRRLADELSPNCQLYASRPNPSASALQTLLGAELAYVQTPGRSRFHKLRHYKEVLARLNFSQIVQICQDKFDPEHDIRRRLMRRSPASKEPVFLLPSAYINVSRTAVAYASLLPERQFLLMLARRNGKLNHLPTHVHAASLDPYFDPPGRDEVSSLVRKWEILKAQLMSDAAEFRLADALGLFGRIPAQIRWGIAIRDAWNRVFESNNIAGCLSADDMNPYTSLPILLAKKRGLPTLSCHHGALDYRMAIRPPQADFYLAKGEMERDYLLRQCGVAPGKVAIGGASLSMPEEKATLPPDAQRPWLVFFTEPYGGDGWRDEEVYRDLLPRLRTLAQACGLKLVFKLHPYESVKGHRRMLEKYLPNGRANGIKIISGPLSQQLWLSACFAMTVQSTVAMDCVARGVPVFLCAWLRTTFGGYVAQYARFGVGTVLESAEQISTIPKLLTAQSASKSSVVNTIWQKMDPEELRHMLTATWPLSA